MRLNNQFVCINIKTVAYQNRELGQQNFQTNQRSRVHDRQRATPQE